MDNAREYELVLMVAAGNTGEVEKVEKAVKANEGKVTKTTAWGEKELAYPINKLARASYFLLDISLPGEAAVTLSRSLTLNEELLRYLLVRKEVGSKVVSIRHPSMQLRTGAQDKKASKVVGKVGEKTKGGKGKKAKVVKKSK